MIPPTPALKTIKTVAPGNKKTDSPEVSIGCVSNVFVRQMVFKLEGDTEQGHEHNFDHVTLLATGKLLVKIGEDTSIFSAPTMIYIKKDITHMLIALESNTIAYCIHGLRDIHKSEDIISPEIIPNGVYLHNMLNNIRKK